MLVQYERQSRKKTFYYVGKTGCGTIRSIGGVQCRPKCLVLNGCKGISKGADTNSSIVLKKKNKSLLQHESDG